MSVTPSQPRIVAFLAAEALSAIGSWASLIAIWGYAAFRFDAGPTDLSLFGIAFGLPALLLGPVAGLAVDRFGPKATLAFAKVVGIAASLLLLTADTFTALAMLSALHGLASTFSHPAIQAMPPRLVDDEHLARTNALVSLTDEVAIVLGPVAAGIAIAATTFEGAFVLDAITYAIGLVALPLVKLRPTDSPDDTTSENAAPTIAILDGWRRIRRVLVLRRTIGCTMLLHLLYGAALLVEPLYIRDVLGRSEDVFAALQTIFGVALVAGGLIVARMGERLVGFSVVAAGVVGSAVAAVIYLATPWLVVAVAGVIAWGGATALLGGPSRTVIQRAAPEHEHGRVLAADLVAGSGAEVLGVATLGFLIEAVRLRTSVVLLGTFVACGAALLALADRRESTSAPPENATNGRSARHSP